MDIRETLRTHLNQGSHLGREGEMKYRPELRSCGKSGVRAELWREHGEAAGRAF